MKNLLVVLLFGLLLLQMAACISPKKVIYATDLQTGKDTISTAPFSTDQTIQVADLLMVQVSALDPEAVVVFNPPAMLGGGGAQMGGGRGIGQRVNEAGNINMAMIGDIKVQGLHPDDAALKIEQAISKYVKEPHVVVKVLNFKVTVLGAVRTPGIQTSQTDRMTILDAVAQAGDIQGNGLRDRVWVIREVDGERTYDKINLNSAGLFASKYYYLKNNDVVYVQPNGVSAYLGANGAVFSTIGAISGVLAIILLFVR